jgi:hypothetical protein
VVYDVYVPTPAPIGYLKKKKYGGGLKKLTTDKNPGTI